MPGCPLLPVPHELLQRDEPASDGSSPGEVRLPRGAIGPPGAFLGDGVHGIILRQRVGWEEGDDARRADTLGLGVNGTTEWAEGQRHRAERQHPRHNGEHDPKTHASSFGRFGHIEVTVSSPTSPPSKMGAVPTSRTNEPYQRKVRREEIRAAAEGREPDGVPWPVEDVRLTAGWLVWARGK
jgi:hypothetical protein